MKKDRYIFTGSFSNAEFDGYKDDSTHNVRISNTVSSLGITGSDAVVGDV